MSQEPANLAEGLGVDLNEASAFLDKVATDAFIDELTKHGFVIKTAERLEEMMKISQYVDAINAKVDPDAALIKKAVDQLGKVVENTNTEATREFDALRNAEMQKAAALAADPAVAAAVIALLDSQVQS